MVVPGLSECPYMRILQRDIHRIHKWRPRGTAWFRIHEKRGLVGHGTDGWWRVYRMKPLSQEN